MTQQQRRLYLIQELLKEQPQYPEMELPQDEQGRKQLLRSLKQDRITIFSTHILDLALDLCDEIVLLNHGELEAVDKSNLDSGEFKDKIIAALREEGHE